MSQQFDAQSGSHAPSAPEPPTQQWAAPQQPAYHQAPQQPPYQPQAPGQGAHQQAPQQPVYAAAPYAGAGHGQPRPTSSAPFLLISMILGVVSYALGVYAFVRIENGYLRSDPTRIALVAGGLLFFSAMILGMIGVFRYARNHDIMAKVIHSRGY